MDSSDNAPLATLFLILGVIALITNLILFIPARKLASNLWEMRLVTGLSVVDIFVSGLNITIFLRFLLTREIISDEWCMLKGPAEFFGLFLSMLLVSSIALERSSKMFTFHFSNLFGFFLIIYSIIYFSLLVITAYSGDFNRLPNGIDCASNARNSQLGALSTFLLGFSLFACLIVIVVCYFRILNLVIKTQRSDNNPTNKYLYLRKLPVIIKTLIISFTYMLLIIPACILLILEVN